MTSMFTAAKVINDKPKAKAKKDDREKIKVPGFEMLARCKALTDALASAVKVIAKDVKTVSFDAYIARIEITGVKPETFSGYDVISENKDGKQVEREGLATGTVQLKRKSQSLTDDEQALLSTYKIPFTSEESTPALFAVNPAIMHDMEKLGRMQKALEAAFTPAEIEGMFVQQAAVSKIVATDETVSTACLNLKAKFEAFKKDPTEANEDAYEDAKDIIEAITTDAVAPKTTESMGEILSNLLPVLMPKTKTTISTETKVVEQQVRT